MLTVEKLKEWGADTGEAMARCLNNEGFYLMLVGKEMADPNFEKLDTAVRSGDLEAGFEAAHSLKGVLMNLALTPLSRPVVTITELLRNREVPEGGFDALLEEIARRKKELNGLNQ